MTLSFESSMKSLPYINGNSVGIIAYGYLPLMLFRSCPMATKNGCKGCSGREKIKDRTGTEFTVLCGNKKYSTLLNSLPLYIGDKDLSGVDFATLYFTVENRDRCVLSVMPTVRFNWFYREKVQLYSTVALALVTDFDSVYPWGDVTLVGCSFGRKFFGFTELGLGMAGWVRAGVGYRFDAVKKQK